MSIYVRMAVFGENQKGKNNKYLYKYYYSQEQNYRISKYKKLSVPQQWPEVL
jgi:hypothetical protein